MPEEVVESCTITTFRIHLKKDRKGLEEIGQTDKWGLLTWIGILFGMGLG